MGTMELLITLIIGIVIIAVTFYLLHHMYKQDEEEFLPSHVKDLNYDPETEILSFKGGRTGNEYAARGQCTVWHSLSGKRLDTPLEYRLSNIYDYWKYQDRQKKKGGK